ncbi:hypothetical protein [Nostoc sp.]|uniref:hypothetical protein n=1 Tax=Nostoc sp. TaxID=1180 RepID=UPI003594191B
MTQIKDFPIKTTAENGDFLTLQNPTTGLTYSIQMSDFLKGVTTGSPTPPASTNLTYATSGDTNGLFYYLGTEKKTQSWVNPINKGLIVSASSVASGSLESLVNRDESQFYTSNSPNSWVSFSTGSGKLKSNGYSIRVRNSNLYYPRNWKLRGSNDNGSSWADLDIQANNTTLDTASEWLFLPVTPSISYSLFQILNYGLDSEGHNYFCLGEVELYGEYQA